MKPIGAEVQLTYHNPGDVDAGDALVTGTGRTYLVVEARRIKSRRSAHLWSLRCLVAEKAPPGVQVHSISWWSRGSRGRPRSR